MSVTVNIPSKIPLKYQPTVFVFTRNSRISTCNPRVSHFIAPKSNGFKKLRFINAINLLARNHVLLNHLIREFSHLMFALSRAWTIMRALKGAIWRCLDRPKRCNNRSQWKRPKNTFLTSHLCDWRRSATFSKLPTCCDSFFFGKFQKQTRRRTHDGFAENNASLVCHNNSFRCGWCQQWRVRSTFNRFSPTSSVAKSAWWNFQIA